jgi:hypothetical protein
MCDAQTTQWWGDRWGRLFSQAGQKSPLVTASHSTQFSATNNCSIFNLLFKISHKKIDNNGVIGDDDPASRDEIIWYLWSLPSLALIVTQADQRIDPSIDRSVI